MPQSLWLFPSLSISNYSCFLSLSPTLEPVSTNGQRKSYCHAICEVSIKEGGRRRREWQEREGVRWMSGGREITEGDMGERGADRERERAAGARDLNLEDI